MRSKEWKHQNLIKNAEYALGLDIIEELVL